MAQPVRVNDKHYRYTAPNGQTYDLHYRYGGWAAFDSRGEVVVVVQPRLEQTVRKLDRK